MSDHGLSVAVEGDLARVTLDRPVQLNAQTPLTWVALAEVGASLPGSVRFVLVSGAGRAFSAGLDRRMFTPAGIPGVPGLAELGALEEAAASAHIARYQAAFGWLTRPEVISIAAVHGHAVGAGFQLALACDLRVVADDVSFAMAEVPLGLVPDLGGTGRLAGLVGYSRALEICVTGRRIGAEEAVAIGLANRAVPAGELAAAAAQTVAALRSSPRESVVEVKALLLAAAARSQDQQEAAERAAQHRLLRRLAGRPGE